MSDERTFERTARAWLELGTDHAPDRAVQSVLLAIQTTPQERDLRIPWRFPTVNTPLRVGVAAVIGLLLLGAGTFFLRGAGPGVGGSPPPASPSTGAPSTSPRPSLLPLDATFTSTIHGISIDYPAGWQVRPATEPWTGGPFDFDSPAADVIFDPALGDRWYLALASYPYGRVPADDLETALTDGLDCGGGGGGLFNVDGARALEVRCGNGNTGLEITTLTRGYLIHLIVPDEEPGLGEIYGLHAALETVDLRPEDAIDAPSPSEAP